MGDTKKKKKAKQSAQIKPVQAKSTSQQSVKVDTPVKKSHKTLWMFLGLCALIALVFPKPQLLTYKKLNTVATSIYWPGLLGVEAMLFDSDLELAGEIEQGKIFLCAPNNPNVGCQKYQIVNHEGFFAVIRHLTMD